MRHCKAARLPSRSLGGTQLQVRLLACARHEITDPIRLRCTARRSGSLHQGCTSAGGDQQACRSVHELLEHESVRRALAAQVYSAEGTRLSRKHAEGAVPDFFCFVCERVALASTTLFVVPKCLLIKRCVAMRPPVLHSLCNRAVRRRPVHDNVRAGNGDQVPMDDECAVLAAGAELVIDQAKHMPHEGTHKVALVFGREAEGLTDVEVARCSVACSIPMGRLQESLSLSHAVALVLGQLYERRMEMSAGAGSEIACSSIAAPQPAAL